MNANRLFSFIPGINRNKKPAKTAVAVIAGIWFNQNFLKMINHHLLHSRRLHCWDNELPILLRSYQ
jgi:hypothetical protein